MFVRWQVGIPYLDLPLAALLVEHWTLMLIDPLKWKKSIKTFGHTSIESTFIDKHYELKRTKEKSNAMINQNHNNQREGILKLKIGCIWTQRNNSHCLWFSPKNQSLSAWFATQTAQNATARCGLLKSHTQIRKLKQKNNSKSLLNSPTCTRLPSVSVATLSTC